MDHSATKTVDILDDERQPCEVWTRVMGYFRPISSYNQGKRGEFHERKNFSQTLCDQDS